MSSSVSRFDDVSRRAFMKRSFLAGVVVLVPGIAACGKSDEDVFGADSSGETESSTVEGTEPESTVAGSAETTVAAAGEPAAGESTVAAADASGAPFPTGAELAIEFTFAAEDTGRRVNNPYIAVWIENDAEELVQTVSLWYNPPKGNRWLPDLKRWYSADQDRIAAGGDELAETISSATRVAGSYSVVWDGTDLSGAPVAQGNYYVCIEGAREHGPYELVREAVTIGAEPFTTELAPDGELTAASVSFVV